MHAERRTRILAVLSAAVLIGAMGCVFVGGAERLNTAKRNTGRLLAHNEMLRNSLGTEAQARGLVDRLRGERDVMKARLYAPNEMNPYSFAALIKRRLGSRGMTVARYQLMETNGARTVEFSVSGPIASFISFLEEVSRSDRSWAIPSLSLNMKEGTSTADVAFRIGYEISRD